MEIPGNNRTDTFLRRMQRFPEWVIESWILSLVCSQRA